MNLIDQSKDTYCGCISLASGIALIKRIAYGLQNQ